MTTVRRAAIGHVSSDGRSKVRVYGTDAEVSRMGRSIEPLGPECAATVFQNPTFN